MPTHSEGESDRSLPPTFEQLLSIRLSRRSFVAGAASLAAGTAAAPAATAQRTARATRWQSITPQRTDSLILAAGYRHSVIARWGDTLFRDTPSVDTRALASLAWLTPSAVANQARQFGANCDAIAYFPQRRGRAARGTLCVNNEYTNNELTFANYPGRRGSEPFEEQQRAAWMRANPLAVPWMQAAHGVSVLEIERTRRGWSPVIGAPRARRITALTPCTITGPGRGHPLLATSADPTATTVLGTLANCAGGKTPWGTYLTAEENIDDYFGGGVSLLESTEDMAVQDAYRRLVPREQSLYGWEHVDPRFDMRREPKEQLRFGWIVEIDPARPNDPPRKRTALGRFQHEGANTIVGPDGRVAVYMGDDETFEYVYKFVTRGVFDVTNPERNRDLLDDGTLYVARFNHDGSGVWLPLVHDERGPLNARTGFRNQGDVVIKARAAADLLGATPMDRPEDIEPNPITGRVYIACTKSADRKPIMSPDSMGGRTTDLGVNAANPRPDNRFGHIIELVETRNDPTAMTFSWNVFLLAGDPAVGRYLTQPEELVPGSLTGVDTFYAGYPQRADVSPVFCPDNLGVDPQGRLWVVTDHDERGRPNNGCFVVPTMGAERGRLQQLASGPVGCEICGCEFTPDGRTLFLSIQHPGEGGTLAAPVSDWPDGGGRPPRAAIVAIEREDGTPV